MTKVLISEKYLHDIANAIRVKLDSQSTYTPAQMAAAIADITGSISGTITPSTDADKVLVTDSSLTAIANAIRTKLDVLTTYTPAQMADAILSITASAPVPTIVPWASGTDEEIAAMIDAAQAGTIDLQQDGGWAVGDVRTIVVDSFTDGAGMTHAQQSIDIAITSFDEYMSCGNVMQFDFRDALSNGIRINSESTTVGGYGGSEMKTTTLPSLVNAMPSWMKNRMIEFSVLAGSGYSSFTLETVTGNKLALRSEIEIFGSSTYSVTGEGALLDYYTSSANINKKMGHSGSDAYYWWLRSPRKIGDGEFVCVRSGSSVYTNGAAAVQGVAPFGCL